jgi:hypothetical protein
MSKPHFDNEQRRRYYGIRVGDVVNCEGKHFKQFDGDAKVTEYGGMDNNCVEVSVNGKSVSCVAEWLNIKQKVETL